MTVSIIYRPPSQTSFLETMNEQLDTIKKETYILGDFNINLYLHARLQFRIVSHMKYGKTGDFVIFLA